MKAYEQAYSSRAMPLLPTCARLDGRAFHALTREMEHPFDANFMDLMRDVAEFLLYKTNARISYTQSDEITLIFYEDKPGSQIFFDGKIQKLVSILASMATGRFVTQMKYHSLYTFDHYEPTFDCRVWQVPNLMEATNVLLWREQDATRNSMQMLARAHYSHKELMGKNTKDMHEMLHAVGVNWNDLPDETKRGTYFGWKPHPSLGVGRISTPLKLPPLGSIVNRVGVIFDGEEPRVEDAG
jgi:tRNA(His) 5'-end guanylyltransferase